MNAIQELTEGQIWVALQDVKDPEIPIISLVELGVIQQVAISNRVITVTLTPTFSGCPALVEMETEIEQRLLQLGAIEVHVKKAFAPAWSSDRITDEGRGKLKEFGLAPPPQHGGKIEIILYDTAACPFCDSTNTSIKNDFGSTLCRSIHFCNSCQQPFEQFKPL